MRERFACINASAARAKLLGSDFRVYIAIKGHADKSGRAFPGVGLIAQETGLSPRTVQRASAKLAAAGLIEIQHRVDHAGGLDTNLYTVLQAAWGESR